MSAISQLESMNGWRLLLVTLCGTWLIGATGTAASKIVHGPAVVVSGVGAAQIQSGTGFSVDALDAMAAALAADYGPLPQHVVAALNPSQDTKVGGLLGWAAGVAAAAALATHIVRSRVPNLPPAPLPVSVIPASVPAGVTQLASQLQSAVPGLASAIPGVSGPVRREEHREHPHRHHEHGFRSVPGGVPEWVAVVTFARNGRPEREEVIVQAPDEHVAREQVRSLRGHFRDFKIERITPRMA